MMYFFRFPQYSFQIKQFKRAWSSSNASRLPLSRLLTVFVGFRQVQLKLLWLVKSYARMCVSLLVTQFIMTENEIRLLHQVGSERAWA